MSYSPPPNPFQSPQVPPQPYAAPQAEMKFSGQSKLEYMRAYNYIFENPNWMMNVLWGFLSMLVPIVGPLVFMGYEFEIVESLLMNQGTRYPDFDLNRLSYYLERGIWPFLVNLVANFVMAPVFFVFYIGMMLLVAGGGAAGGEEAGAIIALIMIPLMFIVIMGLVIVLTMFLLPMIIRAGLSQDFAQGFNFGWIMSFVKKMWAEMLLVTLFMSVSGLMLVFVGALVFCVGMYFAAVIVMLASTNFQYQLYQIFLTRGGEPIPLKPRLPPPQMMQPNM